MPGIDGISLSLGAAFVAGLAGSGHCAVMCGGVAGALGLRASRAPRPAHHGFRTVLALAYNASRVTSYAIAGALAGLAGQALVRLVDVGSLSIALRVLAGAVMLAAAARILFGWRLLDPLEAAGARLWRLVLPGAARGSRHAGIAGAIGLGLAWGWLPCGLSYSMLLLAATTAHAGSGALVMAVFGLGTLPAMVTATVAFERAARALATNASLRSFAGVLLLGFGAWTAGSALYHGLGHHDRVHASPGADGAGRANDANSAPSQDHAHHR